MTDHKRDVRNLLTNARELCDKLGLLKGSKRNGPSGLLIRCPEHEEHAPSCSVKPGPDGTLFTKCHACGWSADALGLVASVYGLSLSMDFPEVLAIGAELGGDVLLAEEIRSGKPNPNVKRRVIPAPSKQPEAEYPDRDEIASFWDSLYPLSGVAVAPCSGYLNGRAIDSAKVADLNLARCIPIPMELPPWAHFVDASGAVRGDWYSAGFRIVLPVYDAEGAMRSVRAWQCCGREGPKRLPPRGLRHEGLILLNQVESSEAFIVEGESDFLTIATRHPSDAVFGVINGGWTQAHADRIPSGARVLVMTHLDDAGNRYAKEIIKSIGKRCEIWRQAR